MKVLLHMCCGPCSVYPVDALRQEGFEPAGLYFNPNIHPREEFERRRDNVEKLAGVKGLDVEYIDDFRQEDWERFSGPGIERCTMCYDIRMEKAAAFAAEKGFEVFTTTLLVSPYQKHELIKELGETYAEKYGVRFLYRDFRPGFRLGQQGAREMGLYRQKYCGCIVSFGERNSST